MRPRELPVAIVSVVLAAFLRAPIGAGECQGVSIFPPDSKPYGKTIGEWGDLWWKWAISIPKDQNPVLDPTGDLALVGQLFAAGDPQTCREAQGPVFFLAGNTGGKSARRVTVPCGMAVFVSILNVVGWGNDCPGCAECIEAVTRYIDNFEEAECTIDGEKVPDLERHRGASSRCYCVVFPEKNLFGTAPGRYEIAASDGIWLMLEPLCPGDHTIHWTGAIGDFALEVTYDLTVKPCVLRRGDATGDGQFDLADPIRILNYMFAGGGLSCLATADLDDDGQILLNDPIYLLTYLFSSGPNPAVPFPNCGADSTPEAGMTCDEYPCP